MRRVVLALVALAALVAAGCGLGAGDAETGTKLVVSDDFGARALLDTDAPKVAGSDTVMRLLQRNAKVSTKYGGGFVQSIDGQSGGTSGGQPIDWFFYVNGILATKGAASIRLHDGDAVWWDRHDWSQTTGSPAVVGSYPEPFRHGAAGKRLPVRIECAGAGGACRAVQDNLTKAGVVAAQGGLQTSFTKETLRVIVGPYAAVREDDAVRQLERGPRASGVYARPSADGKRLVLLDADGKARQTLGADAGLVAATRYQGGQPVWIVTGTDARGVADAAGALDPGTLKNHFALATDEDRGIGLPVTAAAAGQGGPG